jgi:hypothetical protein
MLKISDFFPRCISRHARFTKKILWKNNICCGQRKKDKKNLVKRYVGAPKIILFIQLIFFSKLDVRT